MRALFLIAVLCVGATGLMAQSPVEPKPEVILYFNGWQSAQELHTRVQQHLNQGYTVKHVHGSEFKWVFILCPPTPEWEAIAKTRKLEAAARNLAALEAKRRAMLEAKVEAEKKSQ